jgi:hypothetical protein
MSKMGRAVLWVQENGLEGDPNALSKYLEYKKKQDELRTRRENAKQRKTRDNQPG